MLPRGGVGSIDGALDEDVFMLLVDLYLFPGVHVFSLAWVAAWDYSDILLLGEKFGKFLFF